VTERSYAESWDREFLLYPGATALTVVLVGVATGFCLRHFCSTPLWGAIVGGYLAGALAGASAVIGTNLWLKVEFYP